MSAITGVICDDFYVTTRLFLKLQMSLERETVLHFFDRLRRDFPDLAKLRRRADEALVLEGQRGEAGRRWIRLDPASLRFGHFAPNDLDAVRRYADLVLEQAPYHLTFSDLDFDHMDTVYGFDLDYRGNHDRLLAETIFSENPLASLLFSDRTAHIIDAQPYLGVALTPQCDLQAYVEVKSRTNTYEARSGQYEQQPISVYLTIRQYWGIDSPGSLVDVQHRLFDAADSLAEEQVIEKLVNPLAAAIAGE